MEHRHHKTKNIKIVVFLNLFFTAIEIVGGLWTNSLAILSDALHDFGDSVSLIASWIAQKQSERKPDNKRTYGYHRISLFAALLNAIVLTIGALIILSRAIPRLFTPEHVDAKGMIMLAIIGVIFNGAAVLRLRRGQTMNEKVLTWHLLEDVFGWVAILIGALIMLVWDNHRIDPILTVGYTMFVLWGVGKNLKETINIFLEGVPAHINVEHIKAGLLSLPGVKGVHDIHVWSLDGETDIFTGHIVVNDDLLKLVDETKQNIKEELSKHHIEHSTIELESQRFCSGVECVDTALPMVST